MEFSKNFPHQEAEKKWYQHWQEKGYFHSTPDDRPPYTIVMPPPNVTGVLHMGHALNNTVQDLLIRHAKMQGFNTCWVPGTDHASIATEAKVAGMLREKNINKNDLSREEFLAYAWEWKEKYGGIILQQLKKLGCALDWERTHFTMDEGYYRAVIGVFVDLYNKGLIYRDVKMINWDPEALTSLSDEEVIYKTTPSQLVYVRYAIADSDEFITIATVRPETIMGDTAVCVHPNDERYQHLKGKHCIIPIVNRKVPIIFDEYIDIEFGTGALKVTPAHDVNDYNLGQKHGLEVVDTLTANGLMSAAAAHFQGMDRFVARKKIIEELQALGQVEKIEAYQNQVGYSERTNAVVEPRLSMQWWCKMDALAQPALDAILKKEIDFVPPKFVNLYRHWMQNIRDWNISRQLSWGQRIPAWYDAEGRLVVAATETEAHKIYEEKFGKAGNLKQDDDCLDTWFSSWLWPMQVFGWHDNPNNAELNYYYPTTTLITAPEIIFFWVARMIMAGYEFMGKKPFQQVYFTGVVRDKQGRKMSKSLGNSPDLLQLIDDFGADAVRFSVLIASPAGNDLLYDESMLEQGRNFGNKIWNAFKLVRLWEERQHEEGDKSTFATEWMTERIIQARTDIHQLIAEFRLSEALKSVYSLIWDDFCSYYLEWIKPANNAALHPEVYKKTIGYFEELLQLLHPFMPFLTEEIYQLIKPRAAEDDLMVRPYATTVATNPATLSAGKLLQELIANIRDTRNKNQIKPKDPIALYIQSEADYFSEDVQGLLKKQVNAHTLERVSQSVNGAISAVSGKMKLYLVSEHEVDEGVQKEQLLKDLNYQKGFLQSVEKKLGNEKFMANAKAEVIEMERKKQADALQKIKTLEESLAALSA